MKTAALKQILIFMLFGAITGITPAQPNNTLSDTFVGTSPGSKEAFFCDAKIVKEEKKITYLEKKGELQALRLQKQHEIIIHQWTIIILILILIAGLLKSRFNKKKRSEKIAAINLILEETNRKLQESEIRLTELNLSKDKFFSLIAHDLRGPFSVIMGLSDVLADEADSLTEEEKNEYNQIIRESARKQFHLLENILEWAKLQFQGYNLKKEEVDVAEVINRVSEILGRNLLQKKIKLLSTVQEGTVIKTDSQALFSILYNIVNNAIKFSYPEGTVAINADKINNGESLKINVRDNGIGMSEEQVLKLFKLGEQQSTYGTLKERGSGIGLILIKEIIEKLGGAISAASKKEKGTTISFILPLT